MKPAARGHIVATFRSPPMSRRRVVVTGIGLISALGTSRETVWDGLVRGRCGIGNVTLFDATGYRSQKAAEIPPLAPDQGFSARDWRRLSRSDQIAVIACREALGDAGVLDGGVDQTRAGVVYGSGTADLMRNEVVCRMRGRSIRRADPRDFQPLSARPARRRRFGFEA